MSENRKEQEQYEMWCMEYLRRNMFVKPYSDLNDSVKCDGFFVDDNFRRHHYFGLSECDVYDFEYTIANTVLNDNSETKFPDFISPMGGFIEHFQVTDTSDTGKGSEELKNRAALRDELFNKEEPVEYIRPLVERSHEKLIHSFKKHWEKHIKSLEKSKYGQIYPRIFMIDGMTNLLYMQENIVPVHPFDSRYYCGLLNGRYRYNGGYSLARDTELLSYMDDFSDNIDFVIFMGNQGVIDIIKLTEIKYMLPVLRCAFNIEPAMGSQFLKTIKK